MNFNISELHTIYEADSTSTNISSTDKIENNINDTLNGNTGLQNAFDNICPISGEVFTSMKKAAADPKNLKIAATKDDDGINMFIEAVEFMTFCEAADKDIKEAADEIITSVSEDLPGVGVEDINVVFPSDALNKNVIGGENRGLSTRNDWAMQLMRGCCHYGMKPRIGIENDKQAVSESVSFKNFVDNDESCKKVIPVINKNWDKIITFAAKEFFDIVKGYKSEEIKNRFSTVEKIKKELKVTYARYINHKHMDDVDITFNVNPKIDKTHELTVHIEDINGKFDMYSTYDD